METVLGAISDAFYSWILVFLLIGGGLYFSLRTGFVQIRMIGEGLRVLRERGDDASLSPFRALMVSTASRVGTGNIAGVAVAVTLGGAGALFWMWAIAIIGASSAFIESTLAQVYKRRAYDGSSYGGPAYYITQALRARWLGMIFAIALIVTYMGGFNMLASFNTIDSFTSYSWFHGGTAIVLGIVLALLAAVPIFGGGHRLAAATGFLVPIMAIGYLLVGLVVIAVNIDQVPAMFASIFSSAFDFPAIFGGFAASAMLLGIKRGLYSNEAGVGSAPNAAASAGVSHPVKQGLVQMLSVYIDTLIICSITGFLLLASGITLDPEAPGVVNVQNGVSTVLGDFGHPFVTAALFLFAFTTLIGNYYYAEVNLRFLVGGQPSLALLIAFRAVAVLIIFSGALAKFELAWSIADILMGIMALINIPVILLLGKRAILCLRDYNAQRKEGREPEFVAADIALPEDVDFWQVRDRVSFNK